MTKLISGFNYRPEVDGLRAVAVLAVILFHAHLGVPGGYVGVDVFFVISGFLITSLILKDLQQDRFTLALFWERRARRILPAVVLVTLSTLAAGWFFLVPRDYVRLGSSAAHQAVFTANIHFRSTIGYFNDATEKMPLLHTWSLAVEEQFYMVVPILLLGLFRFPRFRHRGALLNVFLAGFLISLGLSCYDLVSHPNAAFYLLPSRAWELLTGCFLAILPPEWMPVRRPVRELASLAGLAGILIPCFFYGNNTPFPGIAALPPCLGTALIIWSTSSCEASQPVLGRVLATRPLVFVGLISYSLYLWHWPLLAFGRYSSFEPLSWELRIGLLALAIVLSVLSWRFVETPFRKRGLCATRRSIFVFAAAGLMSVLMVGVLIVIANGYPLRLPPQARIYAEAKADRVALEPLDVEGGAIKGNFHVIGNPDPNVVPNVLLWGDSHAMAAFPAFDALLKERGITGRAALHAAVAPVLGFTSRRFRDGRGTHHNAAVFECIRKQKFTDVFLVARWSYYGNGDNIGACLTPIETDLLNTVQKLVETGVRPWVLLQVPEHTIDVPTDLARSIILNRNIDHLCARPRLWNGLSGSDDEILRKLEASGAHLIDPRPRFLDSEQAHYVISAEGAALYTDATHLSIKGAMLMLLPLLRDSFNPVSATSKIQTPEEPADSHGDDTGPT